MAPSDQRPNHRILIIDDTEAIHSDLRKALGGAGATDRVGDMTAAMLGLKETTTADATYEFTSALQGKEGVEKVIAARAAGSPFAMAFVDMRMPPGWDGLETIEHLWKADPHVEIVICTAFSDHSWEHIRQKLGATDRLLILRKPFDTIEVRQLASSLTSKWQLAREAEIKQEETARLVEARTAQLAERTREMEAARDAAQAANRAKSEFFSTMSHEIRTPLNGTIGMIELLSTTTLGDKQRGYLDVAKSSAEALLSLINDILDFSKIEAGKLELESIPFHLHDEMEKLGRLCEPMAQKKSLELTTRIQTDVPDAVLGDWTRLRQILLNFVSNAIKFTSAGGVAIRCAVESIAADHAVLHFSVTDTGIGIPPDRIGRLFKTFSQVDASTTRKYGGTGLGLAISKRLCEGMGGQIGLTSEPGRGSTFWFTARLALNQHAHASAPPRIDPRHMRVLALGLGDAHRQSLSENTAPWGVDMVAAASEGEALTLFAHAAMKGQPFGLVLIDADNREIDPRGLLTSAMAYPKLASTSLVLVALADDAADVAELQRRGFASVIRKTALGEELFCAIVEAASCAMQPNRPREAHAPAPQEFLATTKHGARILVADDNQINQIVAVEILNRAGLACEVVDDGGQALEAALSGRFDAVLMDCQMPEMDGFEATRRVRLAEAQRGDNRRIPIIALTANALTEDRARCIDAGMDDFVTKPFDPKKLIQVIDAAIKDFTPRSDVEPPAPTERAEPPIVGSSSASQASAASEGNAPLNVSALVARCMNNVEMAAKIVKKFESQAMDNVRQITDAMQARDARQVGRVAHTLKGTAGVISADAVAKLARRLEAMSAAGELEKAHEVIEQLTAEVRAVLAYAPGAVAAYRPEAPSLSGERPVA